MAASDANPPSNNSEAAAEALRRRAEARQARLLQQGSSRLDTLQGIKSSRSEAAGPSNQKATEIHRTSQQKPQKTAQTEPHGSTAAAPASFQGVADLSGGLAGLERQLSGRQLNAAYDLFSALNEGGSVFGGLGATTQPSINAPDECRREIARRQKYFENHHVPISAISGFLAVILSAFIASMLPASRTVILPSLYFFELGKVCGISFTLTQLVVQALILSPNKDSFLQNVLSKRGATNPALLFPVLQLLHTVLRRRYFIPLAIVLLTQLINAYLSTPGGSTTSIASVLSGKVPIGQIIEVLIINSTGLMDTYRFVKAYIADYAIFAVFSCVGVLAVRLVF